MKILGKILQAIILFIIGLWMLLASVMLINTYFVEEVSHGDVIDIRYPFNQQIIDIQTDEGKIVYLQTNVDMPFFKFQPKENFEIGQTYTLVHTPLFSMRRCRLLKGVHKCE